MEARSIAPCGLYCPICLDNVVHGYCHGCGCDCGRCAGTAHMDNCTIAQCALSRGYDTCAECPELPCTELILFAYHPFAIHHLPVIETLRRLRQIGRERLVAELDAHFADEEERLVWAFAEEQGGRRREEYQAWKASLDAKTASDGGGNDA